MNKSLSILSLLFSSALLAAEPCFTNVTIRQSNPYPWGGSVVIDYEARNDFEGWAYTNGYLLATHLRSLDPDAETAKRVRSARSFTGELSIADGAHSVVWDVERDGVALESERVSMEVVTLATPAQFCVIDISGGAEAERYPIEYLASEPAGGFNHDIYKTTKIVLKRVNPGSYVVGSNQTESVRQTHKATLTKPYFLGLFELTQKQWKLVTGTEPTTGYGKGDMHAVYKVPYNAVVGSEDDGFEWPATGNAVASDSFFGRLRAKTKLDFDLPTEGQWEYACRAGSKKFYQHGSNKIDGAYIWYSGNAGGKIHEVGKKLPNAWGFYDMLGNAKEWCRDNFVPAGADTSDTYYGTDPVGPAAGSGRTHRGGGCCTDASGVRCYSRASDLPSTQGIQGIRICLPINSRQ